MHWETCVPWGKHTKLRRLRTELRKKFWQSFLYFLFVTSPVNLSSLEQCTLKQLEGLLQYHFLTYLQL